MFKELKNIKKKNIIKLFWFKMFFRQSFWSSFFIFFLSILYNIFIFISFIINIFDSDNNNFSIVKIFNFSFTHNLLINLSLRKIWDNKILNDAWIIILFPKITREELLITNFITYLSAQSLYSFISISLFYLFEIFSETLSKFFLNFFYYLCFLIIYNIISFFCLLSKKYYNLETIDFINNNKIFKFSSNILTKYLPDILIFFILIFNYTFIDENHSNKYKIFKPRFDDKFLALINLIILIPLFIIFILIFKKYLNKFKKKDIIIE